MKLPVIKDVLFVTKKVKLPNDEELARKAWVVGLLIIIIGLIGFIIHTLMFLF
ncbi:MAG: preprotein translocase subunit SecE [Candidatus Anstonellales archaeon]